MDAAIPMLQRILLPLVGSVRAEQAIPYAWSIAEPDAQLVLLRVMPSLESPTARSGSPVGGGSEPEREAARRQLAATVARIRAASPNARVETVVVLGNPATEIVRVARERGLDLIVMASQGRNELTKRVLGSVADQVARAAGVPVMVVRGRDGVVEGEGGGPRFRRLVVPLDGSDRAMRALAAAEAWARRDATPICLLAAVDPAHALPPSGAPAAEDDYRDALAELRMEAQLMLEGTGARLLGAGFAATWQVIEGPAADAIIGAARAGDLIVLTSRGWSGAARWPLGSVAEKVVRYAPVPVLHGPPTGGPRGTVADDGGPDR